MSVEHNENPSDFDNDALEIEIANRELEADRETQYPYRNGSDMLNEVDDEDEDEDVKAADSLPSQVALKSMFAELLAEEKSEEDPFADLNALLKRSNEQQQLKARSKSINTMLSRKNLSSDERQQLLADRRKIDEEFNWRPVATVALWEECLCARCGSSHRLLQGLYVRSQHRRDGSSRQLVNITLAEATGTNYRDLTKLEETMSRNVDICEDCVSELGYGVQPSFDLGRELAEGAQAMVLVQPNQLSIDYSVTQNPWSGVSLDQGIGEQP